MSDEDEEPDISGGNLLPSGIFFRENQKETIDIVLSKFRSGARIVFLDAPVGSGKSLIHLLVARGLDGAYITTPQTLLVDQYAEDTASTGKFHGLAATLYGRGNYPCPYLQELAKADGKESEATADGAPCTFLKIWPKPGISLNLKNPKTYTLQCPRLNLCPYYIAKALAQSHLTSVTTLAYLFTGIIRVSGKYGYGWSPRPLLVVDEAHGLVEDLVQFHAVEIKKRTLPRFDFVGIGQSEDPLAFVRENLPSYLQKEEENYEVMMNQRALKSNTRHIEAIQRQFRLLQCAARIMSNLFRDDVEWVYTQESEPEKHLWRPLEIMPFVSSFWSNFDYILLGSATFLGIPTLVHDLGLLGPWAVVSMRDVFPASHAPIRILGTVWLNKDRFDKEMPRVISEIARIAELHPQERGLIHCNSYKMSEKLAELAQPPLQQRLVFHSRNERNECLDLWKEDGRGNSIFVGVGMSEGLDLMDDIARWQVIVKAPYPNLGDPWIVRRKARPGGYQWYDEHTIIDILQACGRVMRSKDDYGATYILDANVGRLITQYRTSLPEWFRNRAKTAQKPDAIHQPVYIKTNRRLELDDFF